MYYKVFFLLEKKLDAAKIVQMSILFLGKDGESLMNLRNRLHGENSNFGNRV